MNYYYRVKFEYPEMLDGPEDEVWTCNSGIISEAKQIFIQSMKQYHYIDVTVLEFEPEPDHGTDDFSLN